jgi:hypothetical protein
VRVLKLTLNDVGTARQEAAGAALGALVAANAPALTELNASYSNLRDAGLRPLFAALPHNTHLRSLSVAYNAMSAELARDVLLSAVRANTSLRQLRAVRFGTHAIADEAEELVAARAVAA